MAEILGTVKLTGRISPTDTTDTYPTHEDIYGLGGLMSVADATAREAISTDRRKEGMMVFQRDTAVTYQLVGGTANTDWVALSFSGGGGISDAPVDGTLYGRRDGAWEASAAATHTHTTDEVSEGANLYYTDARVSANVDVAANTAERHTHANKVELDLITDGDHDVRTDNPHGVDYTQTGAAAASHSHVVADVTDFDAEVASNTDVAANTLARHTHANKAELDLVTDGDHDVRTDNPHGVTPVQIGAADASHTHPPSDLTQAGATDNQVLTWDDGAGQWQPASAPVESVNGETGVVVLDHTDVGAAAASHSHVVADVTDFDAEVASNTDVAANTSARHTHANKAELDLVTDGDHDVRTDNPHAVDYTQTGAAAASHTHGVGDLTQSGATVGQGLVWDGASWVPDVVRAATTATVYVSPAGDDATGDGSAEEPFATIQKGIDEATTGQTVVCLGAGDFAESVNCVDGVDVILPYSDLTLNDGDQLTLAASRVVVRRLLRTSGTGAMVVAANTTGYAILQAFEINDDGSGDTLYSTNSAPLDLSFSQAFVGNGNAFLTDDSSARHVHVRGEDIYLDAANTTAVRLSGGSTVLMTVHHIKELGAGVGTGTVFDINEGDVNVACQEVGAATLADIEVDGNLNISAQQATGTVTNDGVYTYFYNELAGAAHLGTNLGLFLDAGAYRLSGMAGNDGAFLTLGAGGLLVPTILNVGAVDWTDDTEAFTDVTTTTEQTVYSVTVDQDFDAGSVAFEIDVTFPYWRTSTARLYHEATLLDTQTYTGSGSPLTLVGSLPIDFSVANGDEFTVTFETNVAPGFEPNRSDITGGFLTVSKTGNEATSEWGSITGTITDQTDLMGEFLSRSNTDIYTPSADYHPATKKYVDDNTGGAITAADVGAGTFPGAGIGDYKFGSAAIQTTGSGHIVLGDNSAAHRIYFYDGGIFGHYIQYDNNNFNFTDTIFAPAGVFTTLQTTTWNGLDPSDLGQQAATLDQVLAWNGSQWAPTTLTSAPVDSVNGETGVVVLDHTDVGAAAASHTHATTDLTQTGASSGDLLAWDGANWNPTTPDYAATGHDHVVADVTDWASADLSINSLTTSGDLRSNGEIFCNYGGPDGDSFIYFYAAGSPTGRSLKWDEVADRFEFDDGVYSSSFFYAEGSLIASGSIYINYGGPDGDSYLYFYEGGSTTGSYIRWDDSENEFYFNKNVRVLGTLDSESNITGANLISDDEVRAGGDVHINNDGPEGDGFLYFYDTGSRFGQSLRWNDASDRFDFSSGVRVLNDGDVRARHLVADGDLYINYGGPDGDSTVYFYDGGSPTGAFLTFDDSAASFATSHDFRVNGFLVVDDGAADFVMRLVSTDPAVGMQFTDNGGTGDFWFNGNVGNGKFYMRDEGDTIILQVTDEELTIADGAHIPYVTKMLNTRGPDNLVSNSLGDLGDNYNWTSWTYDPDAVYEEAGAAGFSITSGSTTRFNDEVLPVDPTQVYELKVWMKAAAGGSFHYIGVAPYDADGLAMDTRHFMHYTNTQTTLAADLNPGDTVVQLTDASNWKGEDGSTGLAGYQRAFVTYGYTNGLGHTYDDYTYSRNHSGDGAWDDTGTEFSGNTLTLSTTEFPSGWDGPTIPAGTAIANALAGSSYKYIAASNESTPTDWAQFSGFIGGVDDLGANSTRKFPPGCAGVKLLFLINRTTANTTSIFAPYFGPPALDWETGDSTPSLTLPGPLVTDSYALIGTLMRATTGEFSGLVNIDRGTDADSCWLNLENDNVDSYLRMGDDSGDYGFKFWYIGTGSGNANSLKLAAENQTGTDIDVFEVTQDGVLDWKVQPTGQDQAVEVVIDGGGAEIPDDTYVDVMMPYAMTIESWWLMADQSGSIDIGVWKDSWANFPPTSADEIVGPFISSAQNNAATSLSISVAKGDVLRINVDSCTTIEKVTLALRGVRA